MKKKVKIDNNISNKDEKDNEITCENKVVTNGVTNGFTNGATDDETHKKEEDVNKKDVVKNKEKSSYVSIYLTLNSVSK